MSYGPCDFQDAIIEVARKSRIRGLPRNGTEWGSDDHESAAWVICRALEGGKRAERKYRRVIELLQTIYEESDGGWLIGSKTGRRLTRTLARHRSGI